MADLSEVLRNALAGDEGDAQQPAPRPNALLGPWVRDNLGSAYPREPYPWTKNYPNLAAFLAKAPEALQALPGRAPVGRLPTRPAASPGEWPTQAAVQIGDQIFTGQSHFEAIGKAQAVLGDHIFEGRNPSNVGWQGSRSIGLDGFITNTGRYVSRQDAGRMVDEHNQTSYYRGFFTGKPRKEGMPSEALEGYDPKTGRRPEND